MDEATRRIIREEYKGYVIHALEQYQDLGKRLLMEITKHWIFIRIWNGVLFQKLKWMVNIIFLNLLEVMYIKKKEVAKFLEKGEAVTTLENIQELRNLGCDFLVEVYVAVTKKRFFRRELF